MRASTAIFSSSRARMCSCAMVSRLRWNAPNASSKPVRISPSSRRSRRKKISLVRFRLSVPQVLNIVVGGKTPTLGHGELKKLGFGLVLYANCVLQGAIVGMREVLRELKSAGRVGRTIQRCRFEERQRLVQKPHFDALEKK